MEIKDLEGRIAEDIVEYIFKASGIEIYRSGAENYSELIKAIVRGRKLAYDETLRILFKVPDFIVVDTNKDDVIFLEVKYRQQGRFDQGDLSGLRILEENWKAHLMLISNNAHYKKPHFQILIPPYKLDEERNPLGYKSISDIWSIDKMVLKMGEEIIRRAFNNGFGYKDDL